MLTYYIVFVGRKIGVCASWLECQQRVFFYKGGLYKYYKTHDEAIRAWVLYPPRWKIIEVVATSALFPPKYGHDDNHENM